jgi:sRNA-binding protein
MKLKKGSAEAKRFMASIRAKKKGAKKVSGVKKTATKKAPTKKTASTHKDTKSHNVRISVVSGLKTHKQLKKEIFANAIIEVKGLLVWLKNTNGISENNDSRNTYFYAINYKLNEVNKNVKEVLKLR